MGVVECVEEGDIKVNFLHPHGPSQSFFWPSRQDSCWVPFTNVISKLSPPDVLTSTGKRYQFITGETNDIQQIFDRSKLMT